MRLMYRIVPSLLSFTIISGAFSVILVNNSSFLRSALSSITRFEISLTINDISLFGLDDPLIFMCFSAVECVFRVSSQESTALFKTSSWKYVLKVD